MGMIIINNYEMPANCYMCDLQNYHECDLTGESIEEDYCWNGDSREKHCPLREVEAIPKADYEARLKADMVDILLDVQNEIKQKELEAWSYPNIEYSKGLKLTVDIIQKKIRALKENEDEYV